MKYCLAELAMLAARLESSMIELGCHVAIGGSCVHAGGSDKDMDVFIYPHKEEVSKWTIAARIHDLGFALVKEPESHTVVPDVLVTTDTDGRRVDFFFLVRPEFLKTEEKTEAETPNQTLF